MSQEHLTIITLFVTWGKLAETRFPDYVGMHYEEVSCTHLTGGAVLLSCFRGREDSLWMLKIFLIYSGNKPFVPQMKFEINSLNNGMSLHLRRYARLEEVVYPSTRGTSGNALNEHTEIGLFVPSLNHTYLLENFKTFVSHDSSRSPLSNEIW